jgi:ElaA protein
MIRAAIGESERLYGQVALALSAQCLQVPFYRRFGFVITGEPYDDGGVDHIDMHMENYVK